jgi:predicted alpha/beta superfamily hydrolase
MPTGREDAGIPDWRCTITGRVDVTHLLRRGRRRAVRCYLPPGYEDSDREYPVLYMFDGQNLFDRTTSAFGMEWGIDETVEAITGAGAAGGPAGGVRGVGEARDHEARPGSFDGAIIVGVDSPIDPWGRYAEYTAWDWSLEGRPVHADGLATAGFLVEQVIPYVRATYRAAGDPSRVGLAGSSLGGAMTLFVGARHPQVFGRLLAFSPVLLDEPMGGSWLREELRIRGFDPASRVYLDMGDAEELDYVDHPDRLVADLRHTTSAIEASSRPPAELVSRIIPGGVHNELAWGARFGEVLLWAFGNGPVPGQPPARPAPGQPPGPRDPRH